MAVHENRFMRVGAIECRIVSDGALLADPAFPFASVEPAELAPLLAGRLDEQGRLPVPQNCLLLRLAGSVVLVDTGFGRYASAFGAPAGTLPDALRQAGVAPSDVDVVILTHGHPDHVGGLTAAGEPAFPRARHYLSAAEHEFWLSGASDELPPEFTGPPREQLPPLERAGLLELVEGEFEVLAGVRMEPAPGHTPGHVVVALESGGEHGLFLADAVLDELNFGHPDWLGVPDLLPEQTIETRRRLLDRAARERALVIGFHLERPGWVERDRDAYRLIGAGEQSGDA